MEANIFLHAMDFKKIAITVPYFFRGEGKEIARLLLEEGFDRVHLRKPASDSKEMAALIESIPQECHSRISLHDHFDLAKDFSIGGLHLNSRNLNAPAGWNGLVSRSFHSLDEIEARTDYDYAFLSPIYPSISKPGYYAEWDEALMRSRVNKRIMALGGVTEDKFGHLQELGFGGAAMLGGAWKKPDFRNSFRLQLITHPSPRYSYGQEAEMALMGGCRWVQVRHKGADSEELKSDIAQALAPCRNCGAIIIVDDHVELACEMGADGVHLGKNDMPVDVARRIMGPCRIIGATANNFEDIRLAYEKGADYIGLGPFRFTSTKTNLSPVLGLEGYRRIVAQCRQAGIGLPIVAIGGIVEADIPEIMSTGVDGVAISSTILNADDPIETTRTIINTIDKCQN